MKDLFFANEKTSYVQWGYAEDAKSLMPSPNKDVSLISAIYCTAQARIILLSEMLRLGHRVLYTDTDSMIFIASGDYYKPQTGESVGMFSDELKKISPHCKGVEFVSTAPKSYALRIQKSPDSEEYFEHIKMKGYVQNTAEAKKRLNFDCLKNMVFDVESEELTTLSTTISRKKHFNIVTDKVKKRFKYTYDKRVVQSDLSTLPYGHKDIRAID